MSFDTSVITSGPVCRQAANHELVVSWASSASAGTSYQVYIDRTLAWSGTVDSAVFPIGPGRRRIWVGAVPAGSEATDFGATLSDPIGSPDTARLTWYGGRYLDPGLSAFDIFAGAAPGAAVGSNPVATVPATESGAWLDGFGRGRFGRGGFGHSEVAYSWQSGPLVAGTWNFAIATIDRAGNVGTPSALSVAIVAPPRPPASPGRGMPRLASAYQSSTRTFTLNWLASP